MLCVVSGLNYDELITDRTFMMNKIITMMTLKV